MPRAFCPECGSEVPVDSDGVCHVGHVIDLSTANVRADGSEASAAAPAPADPNEPEPWVASVDTTTLGGYTPPPDAEAAVPGPAPEPAAPSEADSFSGVSGATDLPLPPSSPASPPPVLRAEPDEPAYDPATFDLSASDDLAAAAAEAAAAAPSPTATPDEDDDIIEFSQPIDDGSDGDALGWTPPTQSPVAGAPIPPPAPVDPPAPAPGETLTGEFDLDDLEAAVSELSNDPAPAPLADPPPPVAPAAPATAGTADEDDDLDVLSAFDEPEPAPPAADLPPPAMPTREIPSLSPSASSPPPPSAAPVEPAADSPAPPAEAPVPEHRFPKPDAGPAPSSVEDEDVDLSNFTAKGKDSGGGGGLKGLFRRR